MGEIINGNGVADPADQINELVEIEVIPVGQSADRCEGAVVRLVKDRDSDKEVFLAAGFNQEQCRTLARQLLTIADAASNGAEMTLLCHTATSMWNFPGQALITRLVEGKPVFEFAVNAPIPQRTVLHKPHRRLILPEKIS